MATILNLEQTGELIKLDPQLGLREMEMRCIYVLPRVGKWIAEVLPELGSI